MTKEEFRDQMMYQATMNMALRMLSEGIITEEEYNQIEEYFAAKYSPVYGTLFSSLSLITDR